MKYLHCQIRVRNFEKWMAVMEGDAPAQQEAGVHLIHLWRSIDCPGHAFIPGQAFLIMEVQDVEKARKYLTSLFFTWAKHVFQYEYHFTEEVALPVA
jgi:hypothetical protein